MAATDRTTVFLNGRFLSQSLTGVQRYAAEIIGALDRRVAAGSVPETLTGARWVLLTPGRIRQGLALDAIATRAVGRLSGHAWDQVDLARAAWGGRLVSLANSGPVAHRRHLVVIHDAQVFRHPEFFSAAYRALHKGLGHALARTARLATVSEFSRRELSGALRVPADAIAVVPNSAEHFSRVTPEPAALAELGLTGRRFFLVLGNLRANKNLAVALAALRRVPDPEICLVVVGEGNAKVFGSYLASLDLAGDPRVVLAGRRSDAEIAALFQAASALVFPSLYEGFGVPPLEAMTFGCPVIASTADAVREVCADAAAYFAPHDADALAALMRARLEAGPPDDALRERQRARVAAYAWDRSAGRLLDILGASRPAV